MHKLKQIIVGLMMGMLVFGLGSEIVLGESECNSICCNKEDCEASAEAIEIEMKEIKVEIEALKEAIDTPYYYEDISDYEKELLKLQERLTTKGKRLVEVRMKANSYNDVKVGEILKLSKQTNFGSAEGLLSKSIDLLVGFVGVAAFALIVFGGFRIIVAAGNDNEIQKAKGMIEYAIIGLVVVLLSYLIVALVRGILYQ